MSRKYFATCIAISVTCLLVFLIVLIARPELIHRYPVTVSALPVIALVFLACSLTKSTNPEVSAVLCAIALEELGHAVTLSRIEECAETLESGRRAFTLAFAVCSLIWFTVSLFVEHTRQVERGIYMCSLIFYLLSLAVIYVLIAHKVYQRSEILRELNKLSSREKERCVKVLVKAIRLLRIITREQREWGETRESRLRQLHEVLRGKLRVQERDGRST